MQKYNDFADKFCINSLTKSVNFGKLMQYI